MAFPVATDRDSKIVPEGVAVLDASNGQLFNSCGNFAVALYRDDRWLEFRVAYQLNRSSGIVTGASLLFDGKDAEKTARNTFNRLVNEFKGTTLTMPLG